MPTMAGSPDDASQSAGDPAEGTVAWWSELDEGSREQLLRQARARSDAQVPRLQAVETKASALVGFSAIVIGLWAGPGGIQRGALSGLAIAAATLTALTAVVALGWVRFRWPQPRDHGAVLVSSRSAHEAHCWLLEEEIARGEENHRRLRRREAIATTAAAFLAASVLLTALGWSVHGTVRDPTQPAHPSETPAIDGPPGAWRYDDGARSRPGVLR